LKRWGLLESVESLSDRPEKFAFRSYRDGKTLASVDLRLCSDDKYDHPYLHIHRADYHQVLVEEVRRLGGVVQLNSEVIGIDFAKPAIHIKGLPDIFPDFIIGADGLKSICRTFLLGHSDPPLFSGDMAYRCTIRADKMKESSGLEDILRSSDIHYWIGPQQHIVCYKLREGDLFNIVIACTSNLSESTNIASVGVQELLDRVEGWDPKLFTLLSMAEGGSKGHLMYVEEMETWIQPSGKFILLGDACHATLPYLYV
jgi:salicylate hydroxylase